jgi:hypothetical protein
MLKKMGLGLGGSGLEEHRIWIDKDLKNSEISDTDKTFMKGHILAPFIKKLNVLEFQYIFYLFRFN